MASVLLLGCPEGYAAALPKGARAIAAVDLGEPRALAKPDLVVIGPANDNVLILAQRVGRAYPGADVLIAAHCSQVESLKDRIRISPYIPMRTDLVSSEPSELVEQAVVAAAARCDLRKGHRAVLDSVRQALATAPAAATSATAAAPSPTAGAAPVDLERRRLRRFFQVYEPIRREVLNDVARATPALGAAGSALRAAKEAGVAESELMMARLERAAVLEEAWEPYVECLHRTGRAHAEVGLGFGQWLEVSHAFRHSFLGRVVQRQGSDTEPFADTLLGMEAFLRVILTETERAFSASYRALMQRHEANARLFAVAVESSDAAILTASLDGTITAYNPAAERLLGYPPGEALGRQLQELTREDLRGAVADRLADAARSLPMRGFETVWRNRQGQEIHVSLTVSPVKVLEGGVVGLSMVAQDITRQKETEERLRQTQKMEAIGRLAGGIAHDFNNLLTVIMAHASLMISECDAKDPVAEALSEILSAAERARALTQQLSGFSRGQPMAAVRIDVNEAVRSIQQLLRRTLGESIEIIVLPKEDLWPMWMDPSQLEQLLMNLALNARDAMPRGGQLTFEAANETLPEPAGALPPGDYVRLRVVDNGIGMAPEVLEHIFEPFFTTKPLGKGTGLGLATCHAIARRSGGDIHVCSEPGRGSTFTVWLPRVVRTDSDAPPAPITPDATAPIGTETVLVVEDEPAVRAAATMALQKYGYRVIQAHNGDHAQRLIEQEQDIALVLTDVVMPQMSGPELAAQLALTHPELLVMFMSGYAEESILSRDTLARATVIPKPFLPSDLAHKVRQVLDARPRR